MVRTIKAAINISAAVLVIAQAAGPQAPAKHEAKKVNGDDKPQISLDQAGKVSSFRLAANDHVTFVPCKTSVVSSRPATGKIYPSTNSGAVNKMVKAGFRRPVQPNRTFLSD